MYTVCRIAPESLFLVHSRRRVLYTRIHTLEHRDFLPHYRKKKKIIKVWEREREREGGGVDMKKIFFFPILNRWPRPSVRPSVHPRAPHYTYTYLYNTGTHEIFNYFSGIMAGTVQWGLVGIYAIIIIHITWLYLYYNVYLHTTLSSHGHRPRAVTHTYILYSLLPRARLYTRIYIIRYYFILCAFSDRVPYAQHRTVWPLQPLLYCCTLLLLHNSGYLPPNRITGGFLEQTRTHTHDRRE